MQNNLVERLKGAAFSSALFIAALYLFNLAGKFEYSERAGQLGPGFWPKMLLGLILIFTAYEIVVKLLKGSEPDNAGGLVKTDDQREAEDGLPAGEEKKRYPVLLLAGCVMTLLYVLIIEVVGFALCTFLYLAGFMYVGRYRKHLAIWISSFIGTLFLVFLFVKVVYVSLPTGVPPFEWITLIIYSLLGIS